MGNRSAKYKVEDIKFKPPEKKIQVEPTGDWTLPMPKKLESDPPKLSKQPQIYRDFIDNYTSPHQLSKQEEKDPELKGKRLLEKAKAENRAFEVYWRKQWFRVTSTSAEEEFQHHLEEQISIGLNFDVEGYNAKYDEIKNAVGVTELSKKTLADFCNAKFDEIKNAASVTESSKKTLADFMTETEELRVIHKKILQCLIIYKDVTEDMLATSRRENTRAHADASDPILIAALGTWENLLHARIEGEILPAIQEVDNVVDQQKAAKVKAQSNAKARQAEMKKKAELKAKAEEEAAQAKAEREAKAQEEAAKMQAELNEKNEKRLKLYEYRRKADRSAVGLPW